jgi:hypothetical protein
MPRQATFTRDFLIGIQAVRDLPREQATRLLRRVASHVGEALIVGNEDGPGTPVDTGNARGHWYPGGEEDPGNPNPPAVDAHGKAIGGPDALTAKALADVGVAAAQAQLGDVISFNNDAAYIEMLNNGHSAQAPQGMTDVVANNWDRIVERVAAELGVTE